MLVFYESGHFTHPVHSEPSKANKAIILAILQNAEKHMLPFSDLQSHGTLERKVTLTQSFRNNTNVLVDFKFNYNACRVLPLMRPR